MEQSPEQEASAKLAQSLAVAVQVLEAALRMQQQNTEKRAAATQQQAAAIRAEQAAQHTAARLVWSPTSDAAWVAKASTEDLARAWAAAAAWAETDPYAEVAATAVEKRFAEHAPEAMAHYDELRESGFSRAESMHAVARDIEAEAAPTPQRRVWVAEPVPSSDNTPSDSVNADSAQDDTIVVPRQDGRADAGTGDDSSAASRAADVPARSETVQRVEQLVTDHAVDRDAYRSVGRMSDFGRLMDREYGRGWAATEDGPWQAVRDQVSKPETFDRMQRDLAEQQARGTAAHATASAPATDRQLSYLASLVERHPDRVGDRPTDPAQLAGLTRAEASDYITALGGAQTARRVDGDGTPHPADVAAESFPHKFTTVKPAGPSSQPSAAPAAAKQAQTRSMSR